MSQCLLPHPVVYGFLSGWNYRRFFKIRPALYLRLPIIRRVSMAPGYDGMGSAHGTNPVTDAIPQLLAQPLYIFVRCDDDGEALIIPGINDVKQAFPRPI